MKIFSISIVSLLISTICIAQNIPIDFETNGNGSDWVWTTFENGSNPDLEIVPNPDISGINTSATVAKFTALEVGQPFAGCESLHGAGIGSFTIDESNSTIRIMVWKSVISDVGIKLVRVDNWSLGEIKIPNTLINEWEQIEFDFSEHIGNTYDQIVIFPDFNDRSSDNIIYFDEVYGELAVPSSTKELQKSFIKIVPNPATNSISIQSDYSVDKYEIYSITGKLVKLEENFDNTEIDIIDLSKGAYIIILKALSQNETIIEKFIKY